MQISVACPVCLDNDKSQVTFAGKDELLPDWLQGAAAEIDDALLAEATCHKGHRFRALLGKHKVEVLLESGLLAFSAGFHTEAVLTFAAALERTYELFLRVTSIKYNIPPPEFDQTWGAMKKQSERQLGAFCFIWLLAVQRSFKLPQYLSEFRNKVVHQGYIPKKEESTIYASGVVDAVFEILAELVTRFNEELKKLESNNVRRAFECLEKVPSKNSDEANVPLIRVLYPSFLCLDRPKEEFERRSFQELLELMKDNTWTMFLNR